MYRQNPYTRTKLAINKSVEGETIEMKLERIMNNNEPITDSAPIVYTERKDGVPPAYNIRTDKWEIAAEAMDVVNKQKIAKSQGEAPKAPDVGDEPTEGTNLTVV